MDPFGNDRYWPQNETTLEYLLQRQALSAAGQHPEWHARRQYASMPPNVTLYSNHDSTNSYLRRFTPDGRRLIGMSKDQRAVRCFDVMPCTVRQVADRELQVTDMFPLVWEASIVRQPEMLCRDFCLVTCDHRYLILASASPSPTVRPTASPEHPRMVSGFGHVDDISFFLVDIDSGKVADSIKLANDYVMLAHHAGVALCGSRFGVLSVRHQVIRLFRIHRGRFIADRQIGHSLHPDDPLRIPGFLGERDNEHRRWDGFHQKLQAFLYAQIPSNRTLYLHRHRESIDGLHFWKFQFIDEHHVLIRLGSPEYFTNHQVLPACPCFRRSTTARPRRPSTPCTASSRRGSLLSTATAVLPCVTLSSTTTPF